MTVMALLSACVMDIPKIKMRGPEPEKIDGLYSLLILQNDEAKDSIGGAVFDLAGDDTIYEPHPSEKFVTSFEGLTYYDAFEKARDILKRHCNVITYRTSRLTGQKNLTTGFEMLPVVQQDAYCELKNPIELIYHNAGAGVIYVRLPERTLKPFSDTP